MMTTLKSIQGASKEVVFGNTYVLRRRRTLKTEKASRVRGGSAVSDILHRKKRLLGSRIWFTLGLLSLLALSGAVAWDMDAFALGVAKSDMKPNVFTPYKEPIGAVDLQGRIFALYGNQIGSVDARGNVYNLSHILVGKVDLAGDVFNQADTYLGRVDDKGNVYNVSGIRVGSVTRTSENLFLIGGAARTLLLENR
jgi:hypothetical protein